MMINSYIYTNFSQKHWSSGLPVGVLVIDRVMIYAWYLWQVWNHYFMTLEKKDLSLFYMNRMGQKIVSAVLLLPFLVHI